MMKFISNFQIHTNLDSTKLKEKLNELIDFDYKKKIGENWIKKSFYGDYISAKSLVIWYKTGFGTGIGDGKNSSKILIRINDKFLNFEIIERFAPIIRIIFFLTLLFLLTMTLIHFKRPLENFDFLFGYSVCVILGIVYLIRNNIYKVTLKKTKEYFENAINE